MARGCCYKIPKSAFTIIRKITLYLHLPALSGLSWWPHQQNRETTWREFVEANVHGRGQTRLLSDDAATSQKWFQKTAEARRSPLYHHKQVAELWQWQQWPHELLLKMRAMTLARTGRVGAWTPQRIFISTDWVINKYGNTSSLSIILNLYQ